MAPTDLENLQTYRSTLTAEIASITPTRDYSIDGQSVSHSAYRKSLLEELKLLNEQIAAEQGPFQVDVRGVVR